MNYKVINNLTGWLVFFTALVVYTLTLEPTTSFWDCGEFISASYKLQVMHPPGAPLFGLIGRMFTMIAPDELQVAYMMNFLSGLCSAFAILFLFWTITALTKKIFVQSDGVISVAEVAAIMSAGAVGALACTFADSFWFSAVEAEVYAMSSFFTALVFWLILKWEKRATEPYSDRWLVLIAYMMGLSLGVHLLNLLVIPAIVFVYYFKHYEPTKKGIIKAALVSVGILAFIQYGIAAFGIPYLATKFDLLFVNGFGMPLWSGVVFMLLLISGLIIWGIVHAVKKNMPALHTGMLCLLMIIIGYSSYAAIIIRSAANPPIDMNNPEEVFNLLSFLTREQYGDRPLLYGQYFTAKVVDIEEGDMRYYAGEDEKGNKKYIELGRKSIPKYDPKHQTIFPRMWSDDSRHANFYRNWLGLSKDEKPNFIDNIRFFVSYQLGFMYGRYFMWNFSGRQNDTQGHGEIQNGNWITGINFIDSKILGLGPQDNLPEVKKDNPGRNTFFMLPFILGLIGMIFHFSRRQLDATIVALLFFFTGIAVVLYLNQNPIQPRERDYAYAGSVYAFSIWIGLGVAAVFHYLRKKMDAKIAAVVGFIICFLAVPLLMAQQGWDDHDRSGKYTARDFAVNYLESCAPNAILFTQGDNDTYPLWYAQEVEGVRTDVRVVNLSLLGVDWYIDQLHHKINDAPPVKLSMTSEKYRGSNRDQVLYYDNGKVSQDSYYNLKDIMAFIASDNRTTKVPLQSGEYINYFPTKKFAISVNPDEVLQKGIVSEKDRGNIVPQMRWELRKNRLLKNDLLTLDIIANAGWERPVYFAISVTPSSYLGLEKYFRQEGMAYRIVPIESNERMGRIDSDIMYGNVMNEFRWGGIDTSDIYIDPETARMVMNLRSNFSRLANALIEQGKKDSAVAVLDKCVEVFPAENVPYDVFMFQVVDGYYKAGAKEKGHQNAEILAERYKDELDYYFTLPDEYLEYYKEDLNQAVAVIQGLMQIGMRYQDEALKTKMNEMMMEINNQFGQPQSVPQR